jgi:predicted ATP-grasp superfamily ATP-dependent carboligase
VKVFVTDGNTRPALAIVRALGREGHKVYVGAETYQSLAGVSRFCERHYVYPDPAKDWPGFLRFLGRFIEEKKPEVILPITEITSLLIAEHRKMLEMNGCKLPFPEYRGIDLAASKYETLSRAERLQIPIPKTVYVQSHDGIESAISSCQGLGYPLVVKPARSRIRTQNGWMSSRVRYASDENKLRSMLTSDELSGAFPILVQKRIHGDAVGIFLCMDRKGGGVLAEFSHKRIREKPPSGGVSVLCESIPVDRQLRDYSVQLLEEFQWDGVAMVEFKMDCDTNTYRLMEVNGRFWGSLQLAIDAGVNFPSLLVKKVTGEKVQPVLCYTTGVRTRWFWGDVDNLLACLFKSREVLKLPPGHPNRLQSLISFLTSWDKQTHCEVEDMQDIRPAFLAAKRWLL